MRTAVSRLILILLLAGLLLPTVSWAENPHSRKTVLVLNSYHQGYIWSDVLTEAICTEFDQSPLPTELYFEYLDAKRYSADTIATRLADLFGEKYPAGFFDLVIAADAAALDFALQRRAEFKTDCPIVFSGIDPNDLPIESGLTGVMESPSYAETIELALRLHPDTEEIIVTGNTYLKSSRAHNADFLDAASRFQHQVKFTYLYDLPLAELLGELQGLPKDRLVMPVSLLWEKNGEHGHLITNRDLAGQITQQFEIPVYINFNLSIGSGAVGGKLVDYSRQGKSAAQIALQILNGVDVDSIVEYTQSNSYMFDYDVLKRFGIPLRQLPKSSVVINRPATSYPVEKRYLWLGGLFIVGLMSLTVLLLKMIYIRRRVEKRLRKSEQKFRSVFETTAVGMAILSKDWKVMEVNNALCQISGYDQGELLYQHIDRFSFVSDDEDRHSLRRDIELGVRKYYHHEKRYQHKTGKTVWGRNSMASVCGEDGLPLYYVSLVQDITEQKKSGQELQLSEAKYRNLSREFEALLDGIPDSLVLLSPQMKVVWGNKGAAQIAGVTPGELAGRDCPTLCSRSNRNDCPVKRCFSSGKREEDQVRTHNDRHLEIKAFPLKDRNGVVISVIEMASDVTEKLQLREEALRSAQLASLGELAAGVAHEINNPINGIINYAQILTDEDEQSDSATEILNEVIQEGCRIANIVGDLLSFARQRKDGKEMIAFKEIYRACLTMLESQFAKDGIELDAKFPKDLPPVMAHKQQIQQVILNILSNAHYALNQKYPGRDEQKRIEICGRLVSEANAPRVQVEFKDYGSGIASDIIDKVVDPFFSTKPIDKGTGLGLSISHGIVSDHQGKMTIDSLEGGYTKVVVELPIAKQEEADHE